MRIASFVCTAAVVLWMPTAAFAQSDCHLDMKDMLQGTLEVANEAETQPLDRETSDGCTLALTLTATEHALSGSVEAFDTLH